MDIECIVPNYNGGSLIKQNIPGVVSCSKIKRVTVIDDASTDDSLSLIRREAPDVRLVARDQNGGFSAAVNDGIRAAESDLILLLNNDVEVTAGFLDEILPVFADDTVFAVCPRIILPKLGGIDEGAKTAFWHHGMLYTDQNQGVEKVHPILYTTGCAAVYRRSMLQELGGFDDAYSPFYWEDADLGYRAWKRGWKSLYHPGGLVYHQHSASISKLDTGRTDRIKARNSLFFIWRNIEDRSMLSDHRRWLPLVLAERLRRRDGAFVAGWREAFARRDEAKAARERDSRHRVLGDREIFEQVGIPVR